MHNHHCLLPPVSKCILDTRALPALPWLGDAMCVPARMSQPCPKIKLIAGLNVAFAVSLSATLTVLTDMLSSAALPDAHCRGAALVWFCDPRQIEALLTRLNQ